MHHPKPPLGMELEPLGSLASTKDLSQQHQRLVTKALVDTSRRGCQSPYPYLGLAGCQNTFVLLGGPQQANMKHAWQSYTLQSMIYDLLCGWGYLLYWSAASRISAQQSCALRAHSYRYGVQFHQSSVCRTSPQGTQVLLLAFAN